MILTSAMDPPPPVSLVESSSSVANSPDLMKVLREECLGKRYDVKISVSGNSTFQVHKDLLEKASPVFGMLLRDQNIMKEVTEPIVYHINLEMDGSVFEIIQHILYNDELPQSMKASLELTLQVLEACFQYSIDRQLFLDKVLAHLRETIVPQSAFKVLQSARLMEFPELEEVALETIWKHPSELLTNSDFLNLGCYDVLRILSSDELSLDEADVFQAAYIWALHQAQEELSETPSSSLKYYFHQVSMCIRFPLISLERLASMTVVTGDLVPFDEVVKLFQRALLPEFKSAFPMKYNDKPRSFDPMCKQASEKVSIGTQTADDLPDKLLPLPSVPEQFSNPRKRPRSSMSQDSETSFSSAITEIALPKASCVPDVQGSSQDGFPTLKQIFHEGIAVSTFEDVIHNYIAKIERKNLVSEINFLNLNIQRKYKKMLFRNCKELKIDAICRYLDSSDASILNFISHFDTMRYIVWDTNGGLPMTPENIWALNQDILLKVNGVIFLNVSHLENKNGQNEDTLVLNYIPDSKKIMSNSKFRPKVLALSNCEFSVKLIKERAKELERLTLYRVWGDFTLDEIMKDFPNLQELCVWKHVTKNFMPGSTLSAPLCLNFSKSFSTTHFIRKLALFRTELRFPIRCSSSAAICVVELVLDLCYCINNERNAKIEEVFHLIFPNIRKLILLNDISGKQYKAVNVPVGTPSLVNCVIKNINSLEEILVRSMRWGESELEDTQLASFLENEISLVGKPKNFQIVKTVEGSWRGARLDKNLQRSKDVDRDCWTNTMEYECYNLNYFYDSVESFELYFLQDPQFPKPVLWI